MLQAHKNKRAPASSRLYCRLSVPAGDADSFLDAFTALTTACEQATRPRKLETERCSRAQNKKNKNDAAAAREDERQAHDERR